MKKIIIRREFLQLSGVNALAAIIASCAPPSTETPTPQPTDEVDPTQTPSQPPTETPPPTEVPPPPIYRVEQTNLSDDAEVMAALTPQLSEVLAIASDMGRKDLKAWEDLSADSFSAKLLKVTKPDGSDESSIFLVQNNQETKPRVYAVHNADGSVQRAMTQLMQTDSENGIEIGYINGIDPDSSPTIRPLFRIKEDTVYFIDSQNQERETNLAPEQVLDPCVDCREYENIALKDGYIHGQKKGAKVEYQLKDASWQEVKKHDYPTRWDDETIIQEINKKIDDLDIASSLRKEKSVLSGGEANANIDNATTTHLLQFNGIVADVRILNFWKSRRR